MRQRRPAAVIDGGQYCITLVKPDDNDDLTCLAGVTMLVLRLQPGVTAEEAADLAYRLNLLGHAWEAVYRPISRPTQAWPHSSRRRREHRLGLPRCGKMWNLPLRGGVYQPLVVPRVSRCS